MLIALAAVASVRLVGALLTTALFVIPSATGVLLGKNLVQVMSWGVGVAILGGIAGLYLSFYFAELPSGAAIVICYMIPYLAARLLTRRV
ncbi:MAG: metal ABC transporter permease, partial [Verrucomicrobia bacterium]|nr:metal ABC transporter permease [Verrucomicrobiota bacterium]